VIPALMSRERSFSIAILVTTENDGLTFLRHGPESRTVAVLLDVAVQRFGRRRIVEVLDTAVLEITGKRKSQFEEICSLLKTNGCDCPCDHHREEHAEECERCLACRISDIVWTEQ
jgi:hypothetical protein